MRFPPRQTDLCNAKVVAWGNWDGVHRGHQAMLRSLVSWARERGEQPGVLTFHPHPRLFFKHPGMGLLTSSAERRLLLQGLGIDQIWEIPFEDSFSKLSPEDFLEQVIQQECQAKALLVGPNVRFGRNREGTWGRLQKWADRKGVALKSFEAWGEKELGFLPSSQWIRGRLGQPGTCEAVTQALGRPLVQTAQGRKISDQNFIFFLEPERVCLWPLKTSFWGSLSLPSWEGQVTWKMSESSSSGILLEGDFQKVPSSPGTLLAKLSWFW